MDRIAQQNLMMQAGLMGAQSLQMVPNSSQMQPQSPMNLNMMNNMGMNMNLNGKFLVFVKIRSGPDFPGLLLSFPLRAFRQNKLYIGSGCHPTPKTKINLGLGL